MTDLLSHEESIIEQGKQRVDSEEEIEARHYAELLKAYISSIRSKIGSFV